MSETTTPQPAVSRNPENSVVREYFDFLCGGIGIQTICCMDSLTAKPVPGFACVNVKPGSVIGAWEQAVAAGSENCTVHVCLNETNLNGRRTEHITSARVICIDIDRVQTDEDCVQTINELGIMPHLVVESSPGKYHLYFKISGTVPLERWQKYQIGFAERVGGDKGLSHVTSLIRVPGFWRQTKDGEWFLPRIVPRDKEWPAVYPLAERDLVKIFPWLPKAMVEGTKKLEAERKEAGRLARKLWKERGKGAALEGALGAAPAAGRNVTLYMVLRGFVFECVKERQEVGIVDILKKAAELNEQFKWPLGAAEVRKTAFSAWQRGTGAGEAWLEKADYLNEELRGELPVVAPEILDKSVTTPNAGKVRKEPYSPAESETVKKEGNGHDKTAAGENKAELLQLLVQHSEDEDILQEIPKSKEEITDQLCRDIWRKDKRDAAKALASALKTGNYHLYATWFIEKFKRVGCFRRSGPAVFLCGKNRWGKDVYYAERLGKEAFLALVGRTVTKIGRRCIGHPQLKKIVKKLPSNNAVGNIAGAVWAAGLLQAVVEKQSGDVVVFQNGVFDLESGQFTMDRLAPIRYSHPLWCDFSLEVARVWMESERERRANYKQNDMNAAAGIEQKGIIQLPENLVWAERNWQQLGSKAIPKFLKYMDDWFPGDTAAVELVFRWFGYGFTTDVSRNKFSFFYGPTRAGKGSICRVFCGIVGDVNYSVSDYNALDGGFRAANMVDKLLVCIEEVEGTQKEHEKRMGYLKKLLGGEKVTVERKYEQPYEDRVCGKFILQSNEMLGYQDKGHALRARMLCLGFERSFEGDEGRDPAEVILGGCGGCEGPLAAGELRGPGLSEGDALGTIGALTWWAIRGEIAGDVFSKDMVGCRALEVGREEVVAGLDLYEYAVGRYLEYGAEGDIVSRAIIKEIIELVCEEKDYPLVGLKQKHQGVKSAVSIAFPGCKEASNIKDEKSGKWKSFRGYAGLRLRIDLLEQDFHEVLEDSVSGRYVELKKAVGIVDGSTYLSEI